MVKKETAGRAGKRNGEAAHTREAKLSCVFTQTKWEEEGYPIRDPDSTTYSGAIVRVHILLEAGPRESRAARPALVPTLPGELGNGCVAIPGASCGSPAMGQIWIESYAAG